MANVYAVISLVRLMATFTNAAGQKADPDAAVIIAKDPDGSPTGYGTGTGWSDQGSWNAATNTPALADGTGTAGHYYTVSAAGSVDFGNGSIAFAVGDRAFYNGYFWRRWPSPSATALTHSATGIYTVDHPVGQEGGAKRVVYRVESVGVGKVAADEEMFHVLQSEVS